MVISSFVEILDFRTDNFFILPTSLAPMYEISWGRVTEHPNASS